MASLQDEVKAMLAELDFQGGDGAGGATTVSKKKRNRDKDKKQRGMDRAARGDRTSGDQKSAHQAKQKANTGTTTKKQAGKGQARAEPKIQPKSRSRDYEDEEEEKGADRSEPVPVQVQRGKHIKFDNSDDEFESEDDAPAPKGKRAAPGNSASAGTGADAVDSVEQALWFEAALPPLDLLADPSMGKRNLEQVGVLRSRAEALLEQRNKDNSRQDDSEAAWMKTVMRSGTLSDKVAAMALTVSSNPLASMEVLSRLLAMAGKKGRRESQLAIDALADLFSNNLLPSDRALVGFNDQIVKLSFRGLKAITDEHLLHWIAEAEIKIKYLEFVRLLESWSFDTLEFTKRAAINTVFRLLRDKPEQEQMLLMTLVNKLGDSERKTASHVVYLLTELLKSHPNMRPVVVTEVEQFIFQEKTTPRGVYYGTIFMTQIVLQREGDEELARKLIKVYIRLFREVVRQDAGKTLAVGGNGSVSSKKRPRKGKKGKFLNKKKKAEAPKAVELSAESVQSKLVSAILTGINRAFPYANSKGDEFEEQIDALFEMVHVSTFNTATQALMLLLHIMISRKAVSDRFYRTLYAKLLAAEFRTSSKQTMFLNVVFRAIKLDFHLPRMRAFLKRLLQVATVAQSGLAAGAVVLTSAVIQLQPALRTMIDPNASVGAVAAATNAEASDAASDDSIDEDISDVLGSAGGLVKSSLHIQGLEETKSDDGEAEKEGEAEMEGKKLVEDPDSDGVYDPSKREPRFSGCGPATRMWELEVLSRHFHPSVRKFAQALMTTKEGISYAGDPLRDFSNNAFLDRFVYRNPRNRDLENLNSAKSKSTFGKHGRVARMGTKVAADAVNSANFLLKSRSEVPEEERFFHDFFYTKASNEGRNLRDELVNNLPEEAGDADEADMDLEEEEDEFANDLAMEMLRAAHGDPDIDDADVEYSESEDEEDASAKRIGREDDMVFGGDSDSDDDDEEPVFDGDEDEEDDDLRFDSDEGDEAVLGLDSDDDDDDDDEEVSNSRPSKRSKNIAAFADADIMGELLESSGRDTRSANERQWEDRLDSARHGERRRRARGQK